MTETYFPINDLLRRRLQSGLTLLSVTACVAATLFLLLFSDQVSAGITVKAQHALTLGFFTVFSRFLLFEGILVFFVGAVIVSFVVFLMMRQRMRDFGLIKAAGCPNGLAFGYLLTELLVVTAVGCILGIVTGFGADYALMNATVFQGYAKAPNFWYAIVVFATFFIFALIFGTKPMLDAARMSSAEALSPTQYLGLGKGNTFKALSKSQLTLRIASRSLFRRQKTTVRIIIFLSVVFILLTVSIAGGIIARNTSSIWVTDAVGKDTVLIAKNSMLDQYNLVVTAFAGSNYNSSFDYSNPNLLIPDSDVKQLRLLPNVASVDTRLIWGGNIQELSNFTVDPETQATLPVGDHRSGDVLIVGVNFQDVLTLWYLQGHVPNDETYEALVGDSLGRVMFDAPLSQSFRFRDETFNIAGVAVDPVNNGIVAYVSLSKLENLTNLHSPNMVLVTLSSPDIRSEALHQLESQVQNIDSALSILDVNTPLSKNLDFLSSTWSVIMFIPLFCMGAATVCLISYLMLTIDEQRQEFAILRATGIKPRTVVNILAVQTLTVLLSSCAVGISIGTIITLLILMSHPSVTVFAILEITVWLLSALLGMFLFGLVPAFRFARKPLLQIMS